MNKEFIPYEQALVLKELGFDEPCFAKYFQQDGNTPFIQIGETEIEEAESAGDDVTFECESPLYQQAFRWFREKYDLHCWPEPTGSNRYCCKYDGNDETGYRWVGYLRNDNKEILFYLTYEEAELHCLKKLIEIVKHKNNIKNGTSKQSL